MLTYREENAAGEASVARLLAAPVLGLLYVILLPLIGIATIGLLFMGSTLLAAPVLGLLYVIVFPFFGIATIGMLTIRKAAGETRNLIVKSVSFGWRPMEAYLAGRKKSRKDAK